MQAQLARLGSTAKTILIVAAAILVALIVWNIIAFVTSIVFTIVKFAILAAVLYLIFLIARSSIRTRRSA